VSVAADRQLIAGFDAGQTHSRCRLAWLDPDGHISMAAEGQGGGVSHLAAPGGEQRFAAALGSSLEAALAGLGSHPPLAAAAIGASGIEQGSPVQALGQALAATALGLPPDRVAVEGDERTALRGAFQAGPGVLVISGTGCIALGRNTAGATHRCGGWGWLLDGAGSAMDIGRDGLALSVQMADGRLAESPLRAALWRALGASSAQEVKAAVVAAGFGPAGFAQLAPVVNQLAAAGEGQARAVIERSAQALAAMVGGVANSLTLSEPPVCGVGGALQHLDQLQRAFAAALAAELPAARIVTPAGDASAGALAMAADLLART
jgi:N-acetylglucosamine kinase-like BadF-type ATPase